MKYAYFKFPWLDIILMQLKMVECGESLESRKFINGFSKFFMAYNFIKQDFLFLYSTIFKSSSQGRAYVKIYIYLFVIMYIAQNFICSVNLIMSYSHKLMTEKSQDIFDLIARYSGFMKYSLSKLN